MDFERWEDEEMRGKCGTPAGGCRGDRESHRGPSDTSSGATISSGSKWSDNGTADVQLPWKRGGGNPPEGAGERCVLLGGSPCWGETDERVGV